MWRVAIAAIACACTARLGTAHETADSSTSRGDGGTTFSDAPTNLDAAPACFNGRVVYLNFDGVTLTKGTSNATTNTAVWLGVASATVPQYQAGVANRTTMITQVTQKITSGLSQFPITLVTTRPAAGPYVMIVFGGTPATVQVPYIDAVNHLDCGDSNKNDVGIVFDNVQPATTQKAADYAIGAIAFGLGLTGTTDPGDCMCGWLNSCQQNAGPCTLSSSITADIRCNGQTNPQNEIAAFHTAFCQ